MRLKPDYSKSLFLLVPLLAASLLFFVLTLSGTLNSNRQPENGLSTHESSLKIKEQKQELPGTYGHVLAPIFKFIVNCNPFRKESGL
jgi:hypothetical protein